MRKSPSTGTSYSDCIQHDVLTNLKDMMMHADVGDLQFVTGRLEISDIVPHRNLENRKVPVNKHRHEICVAALPSVVLGTFCGDL
ncbi:unnamed protein product [Taenia asiatica]|uniref:Plexin_cytopl domain-containing protein n=1 Tax=Taenia asiatica TaxID=60517 RepID=A0A0R3W763_TAEAS|nr:unnamed protein product [Taenia asiatica]